jgi:hypothetical protein
MSPFCPPLSGPLSGLPPFLVCPFWSLSGPKDHRIGPSATPEVPSQDKLRVPLNGRESERIAARAIESAGLYLDHVAALAVDELPNFVTLNVVNL